MRWQKYTDFYYPPLYRYISFRVSDSMVAEDLTSEVFLRLLNSCATNMRRKIRFAVGCTASQRVVVDHYRKMGKRTKSCWMNG